MLILALLNFSFITFLLINSFTMFFLTVLVTVTFLRCNFMTRFHRMGFTMTLVIINVRTDFVLDNHIITNLLILDFTLFFFLCFAFLNIHHCALRFCFIMTNLKNKTQFNANCSNDFFSLAS